MMQVLAMAAAIMAAQAAASGAAAASIPATAPADADQQSNDPKADLAELQQLYDSSCGDRGYGEYDDVCNQIAAQMREAHRRLDRQAREPRAKPPAAAADRPPSS